MKNFPLKRKLFFKLFFVIFSILSIIIIHSCRKDLKTAESSSEQVLAKNKINLAMLQKNYSKGTAATKLKVNDLSQQTLANIINSLNVDWTSYTISTYPDSTQVVEFSMPDDTTLISPAMPAVGDSIKYFTKTSAVFILRADTVNTSFFMKTVEDCTAPGYQSVISYLHYQQIPGSFTGNVYYFTLNRDFLNGWSWQNGSLTGTVAFGSLISQTNNSVRHIQPDEVDPCVETTYTIYLQTYVNGVAGATQDLYSYTVISCPGETSSTGPPSGSGTTSGGGGASGAPSVPAQNPCTPAAVTVQSIRGRVVDVESGGGGTGSGGSTSNPCTTVKTTSTTDPCAQKVKVGAQAANSVVAAKNTSILTQTNNTGIENGTNQNLTAWPGSTFVNTAITKGTASSWTPNFTWNATDGYTIGFSHGHPGGTGPSPNDVMSILYPTTNPALTSAGPAALAYYENNASVTTETSTGSYIVTVSNWSALGNIYTNSFSTTAEQNTFNNSYISNGQDYATSNDDATQGDIGVYALLQMFPGAIDVYFAPPGSTTYTPLIAGDKTLAPIPCPTN